MSECEAAGALALSSNSTTDERRRSGMRSTWVVTAAAAAAFLAGPRANAQLARVPEAVPQASTARVAAAPATFAERGPTANSAALAPRLDISGENAHALAAARRPFGLSQTLMIVGGAAFVAGAIIGDDAGTVMMVAGAGVGLYGLYLYLHEPSTSARSRSIGVGYRIPVSP
jgi:hypothetical protein